MSNMHRETYELLKWAKQAAKANQNDSGDGTDLDEKAAAKLATLVAYREVAHTFWEELCKALGEPVSASPEHIYNEISAYGGNSIANKFRGGDGVPYPEVAYDVAKAVKKWGDDKDFVEGDVSSCEKFVLKKMEVDENVAGQVKKQVSTAIKSNMGGKIGAIILGQIIKAVAIKVAQQVARAILIRIASSINPILAALALIDLAGPAMRKTIPAVTYVALLRQLYRAHESGL